MVGLPTGCQRCDTEVGLHAEDLLDAAVAGGHGDTEGHGRAARETIVLLQVDRLVGELLHVEGPQETSNGEEDLLLGERDTRADTTARGDYEKQLNVGRCSATYPAPNIQWSRWKGSAKLADSALE